MAEAFNAQISVDATQAEKGLKAFEQALGRTENAAKRFESSVARAFASLDTGDSFSRLAREVAALSSASQNLSRAFASIGKGLSSGRAASGAAAAIARLTANIQALNAVKPNPHVATALYQISNAINGLKFSSANSRNMQALIRSLESADATRIERVATALSKLSALSGFRLSATTARNVGMFGTTGGNIAQATSAMHGFAGSIATVTTAFGLLNGAMAAFGFRRLTNSILETGTSMQAFSRIIESIATSPDELKSHADFLRQITTDLPIALDTGARSYAKFAASARLSGSSVKEAQDTFRGFAVAAASLKLRPDQFENVTVALEQAFAKGTVQSEELKRQISQFIPGVVELMAQSIDKTPGQLMKLMEAGQVPARELVKLAGLLENIYGASVPRAMLASRNQATLFGNALADLRNKVFESGFDRGLSAMLQSLRAALSMPEIQAAATRLGSAFEQLFRVIGSIGVVAAKNIEPLSKVAIALGSLAALGAATTALRLLLSPFALILSLATSMGGALFSAARGIGAIVAAAAGGQALNTLANGFAAIGKRLLIVTATVIAATAAVAGLYALLDPEGFERFLDSVKRTGSAVVDSITSLGEKLGGVIGGIDTLAAMYRKADAEIARAMENQRKMLAQIDNDQIAANARREAELKRLQALDPNLGSKADALLKRLDPLGKALKDYADSLAVIKKMEEGGFFAPDTAKMLRDRLDRVTLEQRNPFAATVRDLREEIEILSKYSGDSAQREMTTLRERNRVLKEGGLWTDENTRAMRDLLNVQREMSEGGFNGFQRWASGIKTLRVSLIDVEKNGVGKLSDALADLSVGKSVDFSQLGMDLARQFNKALIDDTFKDIFKNFKGNSPLSSLFGIDSPNPNAAISTAETLAKTQEQTLATRQMIVMADSVMINGAPITASSLPTIPGSSVNPFGSIQNSDFPVSGALSRRFTIPEIQRSLGMTPSLADRVKGFEGFSATPYWDIRQWSSGYGTRANGPGEIIDRVQADARLNAELAKARAVVERVNPNLDSGTKDALSSLTFNAGDKWTRAGLGNAIRAGDLDTARNLFLQYNRAGGDFSPALASRRLQEAQWGFGADQQFAQANSSVSQLNSTLANTATTANSATTGFEGLGSGLETLFKGLGSGAGSGGFNLFGLFKEGGYSTSPVSVMAAGIGGFRYAPHYAEGTPMASRAAGTPSIAGGFPAVLHDSEAVVPLTRGRQVPVHITSDQRGDGPRGNTVINLALSGVKDYESFRKSKSQIKSEMLSAAVLANQRNG